HRVGAAAQVVLGVLEQARQQRRAQDGPVLGQRVVDARQPLGGQARGGQRLFGEQVVVVRLAEAERGQARADAARGGLDGGDGRGLRGERRESVGNPVVA